MLPKALLLTACLCLLSAPLAMAGEKHKPRATSAGYTKSSVNSYGVCARGANGSGGAINWVKNEGQCRNSSNGQSWVENGIVIHNYQRDH